MLSDLNFTAEQSLRLLAYPPEDLEPEDALYRNEVQRVVDNLPNDLRLIAQLVGINDYRQIDVATYLNVDQSTISRRWKKALAEISKGLKHD
jgi:DNA-directed RNA polymerase specialized sigma24 family protein